MSSRTPALPARFGIMVKAPKATTAAMGRFTYRHQRQSRYWVRNPPRMSPNAAPPMAIEA
jgi:hypothetical protein